MGGGMHDFFGGGGFGGFGGGMGGGFTSMQTFSSSMGNAPGSSSVKSQTFIENGKRITRTEKTTVDQAGRKTTVVTEETDEGNGRR
jgi:hypothetical protein